MGRLLPFRRRRGSRWTRAGDYGAPERLRFWPDEDEVTVRGVIRETFGWLGKLRPFILGAILLIIWPAADPALIEPPSFLATEPERVARPSCSSVSQTDCALRFTRCGRGRGYACVIDGDTIKLGDRKIRIIGIDTPEVDARCPAEAAQAEAATAELQRLLNQGPFEMVGRIDQRTDKYGRELLALRRTRPDGTVQSIAEEMRGSGVARRYLGGFRSGWC